MVAEVIAGIDVSAKTLDVAIEVADEQLPVKRFSNDAEGHRRLSQWLRKWGKSVRVVLESTGVYSLDVALRNVSTALRHHDIEFSVAPLASN